MTPDQLAMNAKIAALTGETGPNYATCLNACRKARRACGLGMPRDGVKRQRFIAALAAIVKEDDPKADAFDIAFATAMQQCQALLRAFGGKEAA